MQKTTEDDHLRTGNAVDVDAADGEPSKLRQQRRNNLAFKIDTDAAFATGAVDASVKPELSRGLERTHAIAFAGQRIEAQALQLQQ